MRPRGQAGDGVRGAFAFALLAAFAALSLLVAGAGARVYRTISDTSEASYGSVTAMRYLIGKVRAFDERGMLEVRAEDGAQVLALSGVYDDKRCSTYIYCDGAQVLEYFALPGRPFDAGCGEAVAEALSLAFSLEGDVLTIELVDARGRLHSAAVRLAAGGGERS